MTDADRELTPQTRAAVRDLVLVLADSKRLLGMRYAGWILGAPELEAGIACASMAQDEWGHSRLLYALLKEFDEDVDRIEHGREADGYCNIEVLDEAPDSWPEFVALNAYVDTALSIQFEAMTDSSWTPIRQRVGKMLDEERFHAAHGEAWFRRLAQVDGGRAELSVATTRIVPQLMRWFGPASDRAAALCAEGVVDATARQLRTRFYERIHPLLVAIEAGETPPFGEPGFDGFDEASRRVSRQGPDARTIEQIRGDKNRVFLMD